MTWAAQQYLAFEDERTRPARDLLCAVPASNARTVIDIGCGPGNSTELLAARFPDAAVRGIDSSSDMIEAARRRLPAVNFEVMAIERWADTGRIESKCDVIFANAVLQWVPNHARTFPALVARLERGGSLAVQMPDNLQEPSHRLMRDIAATGPWAAALGPAAAARTPIMTADGYHRLLRAAGCRVEVWRTTYHHQLAGAPAVVEWFKGSGLRPFLDPLEPSARADFLARYEAAVTRAYPAMPDGSVLLPFPRLFIVAIA